MFDIILGVLSFSLILVLFKLLGKYNIDTLQAIVFNYFTASSLGFMLSEKSYSFDTVLAMEWFPYTILIGLLFILTFFLLARGAQTIGMAISTIANKMSVIIPVIAAFFLYGDDVTFKIILGVIMAIAGVILATTDGKSLNFDKKYLWLILIIFFGQGMADVLFNYVQVNFMEASDTNLFITVLFFSAGIAGLLLLIKQVINGNNRLKLKNILWGIALGIPNYLTVLFFYRALDSNYFQSSQVYPIFNIGVVVITSILGFFIFKEKLKLFNWIGIALSILAIILISFS